MKINLHQEHKFLSPWSIDPEEDNFDWVRMRNYEDLNKSDKHMWLNFTVGGLSKYYVDEYYED